MYFTIPNLFTMIRARMTPFILYELAHGRFLLGGWLFGGAAITDMLDGAVARRFGGESKIGAYLDPLADKILLSAIYIGLAAGRAVPVWLVVVIFGRDLWILLLSVTALKFTKFRDLNPSVWGKASTFLQVMTAIALMAANGYRDLVLARICDFLIWGIVGFAAVSAGDYTIRGIKWLSSGASALSPGASARESANAVDLRGGRE
ncbi:MAG: CDP-alcohol phosphatidyltransferase family protein [Acidobacteriota bacterium]|nr:CDP-alcohol phosphatidyltransferase family protein [Acidobacteriota bacterium]